MIEEDELKQQIGTKTVVLVDEDDINIEIIKQIISWNRNNRKLKDYEIRFMSDLSEGRKALNDHNKRIALLNYKKVIKYGFSKT